MNRNNLKPAEIVRSFSQGFSLIEMAVALAIMGALLGGTMSVMSTQHQSSQFLSTRKTLDEIKQALLGYAITNQHLPCPDRIDANPAANDGIEDFDAATGICAPANSRGNIPWVTLGIAAQDEWGQPYQYRVQPNISNRPPAGGFTLVTNGTMWICAAANCAAPPAPLTIIATVFSLGSNRNTCAPATCVDEGDNTDADNSFVSRIITPPGHPLGEFDDVLVWISTHELFGKLVAAGRMPL